jgi:hypothetical protein
VNPITETILAQGYTVRRQAPRNLRQEDLYYFEHEYEKTLPPCRTQIFHQAYFSEDGVIYTNRLDLVPTSVVDPDWLHLFKFRYVLANFFKKKQYTLNDDNYYISVVDLWSSGYAHWILDALPRLYASREILPSCVLLLPQSHYRNYILETIKMFSIKAVHFIPNNMYAKVKNLVFVTPATPQGQNHEQISQGTREKAWQYITAVSDIHFSVGEKIYVSREKAPKRHIVNEKQVQQLMQQYGFKVIYFEDYTIQQQIALMRNAKYVVSLHGAGASNILFMQKGSHFLEIRRKEDTHNNLFFSLSSAMQVNYWYYLADFQASPKADGKHFDLLMGNYYDAVVNVTELENTLQEMLAAQSLW